MKSKPAWASLNQRKRKPDLSKIGFNSSSAPTVKSEVKEEQDDANKPNDKPKQLRLSSVTLSSAQDLLKKKLEQQSTAPKQKYVTAAEKRERQLEEAKQIVETSSVKSGTEALKAATIEPAYEGGELEPVVLPDWMEEVITFKSKVDQLINMPSREPGRKEFKHELIQSIQKLCPVFPNLELMPFQHLALPRAFLLMIKRMENCISIMPTGSGKTFIMAYLIKVCRRFKVWDKKDQIWIVTKPSIVMQTQRVIINNAKLGNVFVTSYPQLTRATVAELYYEWKMVHNEEGVPVEIPEWNPWTKPRYAFFDESQCLKNSSTQSRVIEHFHTPIIDADSGEVIKPRPVSMFLSATPYSKPLHTRYAAVATRPMVVYSYMKKRLKPSGFTPWINNLCRSCRPPVDPNEPSKQAMAKIQIELEPYTIRLDKVQFKRRTIIKQDVIEFESEEEAQQYASAFERYLEKRRQIEAAGEGSTMNPQAQKLVAILKLRQESELIRAPRLADRAIDFIMEGKNVIIACAFKDTLEVIKAQLMASGLEEEKIALIVGGQTKKLRQKNIDKFQRDEAQVMIMMFSAGGAGLSLHQYDGQNKRPRVVLLPPVWNAEELVQVLGRAHRVNSDSTTYQYILWYRGTIEEDVAERVKKKCSALKSVTGGKDDWSKAFTGEEIGGRFIGLSEEEIENEDRDDDDDEEQIEFHLPIADDEESEIADELVDLAS